MPAISFQPQFVDMIEAGTKNQTIRKEWKRPIKVGDTLQLFEGLRTKACRELKEVRCVSVEKINLSERIEKLPFGKNRYFYIHINESLLKESSHYTQALLDGFKDIYEMFNWFEKTHGLPFKGVLIKWEDIDK